jgi:hypothetical protein
VVAMQQNAFSLDTMRRTLLTLLLAVFGTTACGKPVSTAKSESERLLDAALPFAERMLSQHGEFFPYGYVLNARNEPEAVAIHDGAEAPPSAAVIASLKRVFHEGARADRYLATALVYDARVSLPSSDKESDAIVVALDHRDQYSALVFFPYRVEKGRVVMGEVFAQRGPSEVFPAK